MNNRTYMLMKRLCGTLCQHGQTVLTYGIAYPQFASYRAVPFLTTLNQQYKHEAFSLERTARNEYFLEAVRDYNLRKDEEAPFFSHELQRDFTATLLTGQVISLYDDTYRFTGGAHGNTVRQADSWDIVKEKQIRLRDLFERGEPYEADVLQAVNGCIACRAESYFPDYEHLTRENFDEGQFYLTMRDVVIFYQQYDIAPYATGIPTFALAMKALGATLPGG